MSRRWGKTARAAGWIGEECQADGPARETFAGFADFARCHQVIVERFGRFPHRNAILGRQDTAEEAAFLLQPGSGF